MGPPPFREITRREVLLVVLGAAVLAIVMHWPLLLKLGETIPKDLGDPLPQSWQVAWGGHALASQPLDFFQSNQFWPFRDTLAFSDALIGYAPAGLIGDGPEAAVARYDLLFLFSYALAFAGAYLLARELGCGPAAALVAGAAFAYAPFRLEQDGHMQVISSGGIPLALALGVRGLRLRSGPWMFAGWAVATWQISIGFSLGLPFAYLLAVLCLVAAAIWWRRGRPAVDRRLLGGTAAGIAFLLIVTGAIAIPYQRVADEHPQAVREPSTVAAFSGPPTALLAAPAENLVWGSLSEPIRSELQNPQEKTLFPGLLTLGLAALGAGWRGFPRPLRLGLVFGTVAFAVLAIGFREEGGLLWPYRWIYEFLPGWEAIRVPGRLVTFSSLGLALLAAGGAMRLSTRIGGRRRVAGADTPRAGTSEPAVARVGESRPAAGARPRPAASAVALAVIALLIAVEGRGLPFDPTDSQAQPRVPESPVAFSSIDAPQLHLPAALATDNRRYLLWSTDGFEDMVNGRSSTQPAFTINLIRGMAAFPSETTVARLRELGVRSVVLHPRRARGTYLADAASRPIAGLGLERERRGDVVVYSIEPAPAR